MAIDWFGDSVNYPGLTELLEATSASMFTNDELADAAELAASGDHIALLEYEDMLAQVINASYQREPKLFGKILWINTDLGTPMWVRPGIDWTPDHEHLIDDDKVKKTRTVVANRRAFVAKSITEQSLESFMSKQAEMIRER